MNVLSTIKLDLTQPNETTVVYAKQHDSLTRSIAAYLTDGMTAWDVPSNALVLIEVAKPDDTACVYDTLENGESAYSIDGHVVTITLAAQALTAAGRASVSLRIYTPDESRLTSFSFALEIEKSEIDDLALISSDYYNVLTQQITAVLDAASSLTGMTASATGLATGASPSVVVSGGSEGTPYNLEFQIPAGPVGPSEVPMTTIRYQQGSSPTTVPTGTWQSTPPSVAAGKYLWTRVVLTYSSGTTATYYSVAYQGQNGGGTLISTSTDVSVPVSSWTADQTYEDYPYHADMTIADVTVNDFVEVVFSLEDAQSGMFAPVAQTITGGVRIWATDIPESAITVATVATWR